jgi:hypothetical protein
MPISATAAGYPPAQPTIRALGVCLQLVEVGNMVLRSTAQASARESRMTTQGPASEPDPASEQPALPRGREAAASARQDTHIAAGRRVSPAAVAAALRELRTRRRSGIPRA